MKIIYKDLKEQKIKVLVESIEDMWHLAHVLEKGDIITARTMRKSSVKSGGEYEYGEKKPMTLSISLEKTELRKDTAALRLSGQIIDGPEDIPRQAYHSMQIEANSTLTIQKAKWKAHQIERLEKAVMKKPALLVCVLDREEADIAILRESGIEMKANITNRDKENMEGYYDEIISCLKTYEAGIIIIAGPGFERENLLKYISSKDKEFAKKMLLEHASSTGINGINEILKKSANRILRETRIAKEGWYVNELLKRIKTDGLAVYGKSETKKAVEMGAVEALLVSQEKVDEFSDLMETQEKMRGAIVIIGGDHELGEQFLHLGGIAGLLRFKTEF